MQKYILPSFLILAALIITLSVVQVVNAKHTINDITHTCLDNTHETCDGVCVCDGMECK